MSDARALRPFADRLTAIIETRMSHGLAFLRDDGQTVDLFTPEQAGWALAHLYLTGDVVSGLPALAQPEAVSGEVDVDRLARAIDDSMDEWFEGNVDDWAMQSAEVAAAAIAAAYDATEAKP